VLCDGDALVCENNQIILIRAASETLTEASTDDPLLLPRRLSPGKPAREPADPARRLRFPRDHVLEEMLEGLGLNVRQWTMPLPGVRRLCGAGATPVTAEGPDCSDPRLHLLHLSSPALPVGAYAYSQGLEYADRGGLARG
jgi:hypothetical protein